MIARTRPAAALRNADGPAAAAAGSAGRECWFRYLATSDSGFPLIRTRIRAHGTRKPALASEGIATVLFHPDFNRRLRSCTESADPSPQEPALEGKALAGSGLSVLTAGGEFRPALRTLPNYDQRPSFGQAACGAEPAAPWRPRAPPRPASAAKINHYDTATNPIPVCSVR